MEFVRTRSYEKGLKRLRKLGASDVDFYQVEQDIAANPEIGDVIKGSGGLRKVRFAYGQAGKSGGGRTIYYAVTEDDVAYLLAAFAKVDQADLTTDELKMLKALTKELLR
jgi:hypothetical protein